MKKMALLLALLLIVSFGGCDRGDDLEETITVGTWGVSYFIAGGDDDTSLFHGYVFTFLGDGTVKVTRPGAPPVQGTWHTSDNDTRFELYFGVPGLLERLEEDWVVDRVFDEEILFHEPGYPFNQFNIERY